LEKYRSPNQTENILLATHERSSEILCNRVRKQEDIEHQQQKIRTKQAASCILVMIKKLEQSLSQM